MTIRKDGDKLSPFILFMLKSTKDKAGDLLPKELVEALPEEILLEVTQNAHYQTIENLRAEHLAMLVSAMICSSPNSQERPEDKSLILQDYSTSTGEIFDFELAESKDGLILKTFFSEMRDGVKTSIEVYVDNNISGRPYSIQGDAFEKFFQTGQNNWYRVRLIQVLRG